MLISALLYCSLATELAAPAAAAAALPPPAGPPALTIQLSAPYPSFRQALQKKPDFDQLSGPRSGPGDGDVSKPSRAEGGGCVEAKATANAWSAARAGEKQRHARLSGNSGFWNAAVQSAAVVRCMVPKRLWILVLQVTFATDVSDILKNMRMFVVADPRK